MNKALKQIIRSFLHRLGYDIIRAPARSSQSALHQRMYTIRTSMEEMLQHVLALGFSPATVIDVGVAYGTHCLYDLFPNARHLLVEPLEEFEPHLKSICRTYNAEYVLAAAGSKPGTLPIYFSRDLTGATTTRPEDTANCTVRSVPVVTLDSLCAERNLVRPYLIKADTQGSELMVLDGAQAVLEDAELVILEVSLFHFTSDTPECFEILHYMKRRGFVVYDVFGGHNRPLDGARAQFDVAFVKEHGMFRESHAWITPEQAAELPQPA